MTDGDILHRAKQGMLNGLKNVQKKAPTVSHRDGFAAV